MKLHINSVLSIMCAIGTLHTADLPSAKLNFSLKTAQKQLIKKYTHEHASSPSFFVLLNPGTDAKAIVYYRINDYIKVWSTPTKIDGNRSGEVAIVGDTHLVFAQDYTNGIWVYTIGQQASAKNIELPPYESPWWMRLSQSISCLKELSSTEKKLLVNANYEGLFLVDLIAQKATHILKLDEGIMSSVLPNSSGDGVWYRTLHVGNDYSVTPSKYTVGHFDLRSHTSTVLAEMPGQITHFSVNANDTYCAAIVDNAIQIYDVRNQKKESPIAIASDRVVKGSLFANNNTLVYTTRKNISSKDQRLETISLASRITQSVQLPSYISGIEYHLNTGLLVGHKYPSELEIYDFGFKT